MSKDFGAASAPDDGEHCNHHRHDDGCEAWAGLCDLNEDDDCVHCDCCCTCLGCEYGPQDGMLMFPEGR